MLAHPSERLQVVDARPAGFPCQAINRMIDFRWNEIATAEVDPNRTPAFDLSLLSPVGPLL